MKPKSVPFLNSRVRSTPDGMGAFGPHFFIPSTQWPCRLTLNLAFENTAVGLPGSGIGRFHPLQEVEPSRTEKLIGATVQVRARRTESSPRGKLCIVGIGRIESDANVEGVASVRLRHGRDIGRNSILRNALNVLEAQAGITIGRAPG